MRTFRTLGIYSSAVLVFLSASVAFAEDRAAPKPPGAGNPSEMSRPAEVTTMTQSAIEKMKSLREDAQKKMESKRQKAASRVADIKDKTKQELAGKLVAQFDALNATWTDRFMQTLERFDAAMGKMQTRANAAVSEGKDMTDANATLQAAKASVEKARTAVNAQAAKTYTLDIGKVPLTDATSTAMGQDQIMRGMRASFKDLHKTLFKDLFALRDGAMAEARKAVQAALQSLGQSLGEGRENATTTSAKSE